MKFFRITLIFILALVISGLELSAQAQTAGEWYQQGLALKKKWQYSQAEDCFEKAVKLKPDFIDAWMQKGLVLQFQLKLKESISDLETALGLAKKQKDTERIEKIKNYLAIAYNSDGLYLNRKEKYPEAIKSLDKAVAIDPKMFPAWFNKGFALEKLGKYQEAIPAYEKAISIDSDYAKAWYHKGVCLKKLGKKKKARQFLEIALEFAKDKNNSTLIYEVEEELKRL